MRKGEEEMYRNILLMRNGCEGCSMETCLGVLLAESRDAKVTAVYVTGDFTWEELRKIYGVDELKWCGSARVGKEAEAEAERRKVALAKEALESAEKMCAKRGIPCETVQLSSKTPLRSALKLAEERRCDVVVASADPQAAIGMLSHVKAGRSNGKARIPVLFHHAV
jgi:nucleotide-binding universal stress UspA family protein